MPKVSIVIPCYNHGEFLPEAVASVISLARNDVELIVVDDGSTDDRTRSEMDALAANGIHVIRQENKGLAAARNAGIRASRGKYILPLDADNRIRPAYVAHGIRILDQHPKIGVVYGDAQLFGAVSDRWTLGPFNQESLLQTNFVDACSVFRRAVWEQNSGYDSTMPVQGFEDWDFWLGAVEHGWEFAYVPEILFDYRKSANSMMTRTVGFEAQVAEFVTRKHAALYSKVFVQLAHEHASGRATLNNLRRIVKVRFKQRFHRNGTDE